ncbi:uncharacterized protein LOC133925067 [Phragmites australis]|uniref:uncharacterized protein LOC133925067 n=1 Tax=Phragmites australis TaxID=29695 RepID=UPI002D7724EE|nr:uncharacterized protein LOC133925067 [Phragmites australis]
MEKGATTRRRRLVERGSDRLAFITGQTSSLPSDPPPDSPLSMVDAASTQLSEQQQVEGGIGGEKFSDRTQLQKSEPGDPVPEFQRADTREETKAKTLSIEDELFLKFKTGSAVPEIQPSDKARQETKAKTLSNEDELFQKFKTGRAVTEIQLLNEAPLHRHDQETLSKKTSHDGAASAQPRREMEMRPRSSPPSQSNQADSAGWSVENLKENLNFTPQEITKAISETESNRLLASIAIAFLVVLSSWGLDIGGTITRVLVGTRPLLFLIITNIIIVLTLLMENKDPNARGRPVGSNLGSADSLGQMLEIGLLLQKALGALLMDCSVCAVIMICFLGF